MKVVDYNKIYLDIKRDSTGQIDIGHVKFYPVELSGFLACLGDWYETSKASSFVLNVNVMPPLEFYVSWSLSFLRSYCLSVHYSIYKAVAIAPTGFTPSKVKDVIAQDIPETLLNMMREICRPMIAPSGDLLYPDPNIANMSIPFTPDCNVRNGIRIGLPDTYLLRYDIIFYPRLVKMINPGIQGQTFVSGVTAEGLEPSPIFFNLVSELKTIEIKVASRQESSSVSARVGKKKLSLMTAAEFKELVKHKRTPDPTGAHQEHKRFVEGKMREIKISPTAAIVVDEEEKEEREFDYFYHAETDKTALRYNAIMMLRHCKFQVDVDFQDVLFGQPTFPENLQFLGLDFARQRFHPVTSFQVRGSLLDFLTLSGMYETALLTRGKWIAKLSSDMKDWNFPSLGSQTRVLSKKFQRSKPKRHASKPTYKGPDVKPPSTKPTME